MVIGHGYLAWSRRQTRPAELPRIASPSHEEIDWFDEKQSVNQREGNTPTGTTASPSSPHPRQNLVLERMTYMTRLPLLAFAISVFAYAAFYIGLLKNPFSGNSGVKHSFALLAVS